MGTKVEQNQLQLQLAAISFRTRLSTHHPSPAGILTAGFKVFGSDFHLLLHLLSGLRLVAGFS